MGKKPFHKLPNEDAVIIDKNEVSLYFQNLGYTVIELVQIWRHLTGHVSKDGVDYFLKLASTPQIGMQTITEPLWQDIRQKLGIVLPISIPKIYTSGKFKNKYPWFISDYIYGHILANHEHPESDIELIKAIPIMSKTINAFIEVKTDNKLPRDNEGNTKLNAFEQLMRSINIWQLDINRDIHSLLNFITDKKKYYLDGACHGDFVPWHILVSKAGNNLYLIDNENTSLHRVKYYDLAYLYHRLYTKMKRPDIADMLLKDYLSKYPFKQNDQSCFLGVLASRIISGYRDLERNAAKIHKGGTSLSLQKELEKRLLTDLIK